MGDTNWADAASLVGSLVSVLWIALAVAVGVLLLAPVWIVSRAVSRRLEGRYLPGLARWSRRRSGLAEDAGPWACPVCSSVNASTVVACYRCGVPRPADAPELADAATDPGIFHRPPPENQFDPSRYRGPGAPIPPPASPSPVPASVAPDPSSVPASAEPSARDVS